MQITLLTTDTAHHRAFASALANDDALERVIVETHRITPAFETFHPFEAARDDYERTALPGATTPFGDVAETREVDRLGDALAHLQDRPPELVVVFGTSRLSPELIETARVACLNLHGGNPEEYRGLDTHLWTIYHRDFENLVTTLHHVDSGLDTGDIVNAGPLPLRHGMGLHELRTANTRVCVELMQKALADLVAGKDVRHTQRMKGRYYSFMPAVLKERCLHEFDRYVATL